jgi:hypothetical protein
VVVRAIVVVENNYFVEIRCLLLFLLSLNGLFMDGKKVRELGGERNGGSARKQGVFKQTPPQFTFLLLVKAAQS